jgi:hypothetical protein
MKEQDVTSSYLENNKGLLQEALQAVEYYKKVVAYQESHEPRTWSIGLYLAIQWMRYLQEPNPDLEELRWFAKALKEEKEQEGIQCHYIWRRANELIEFIESKGAIS